jgi:hypothetical protein
VDRASELAKPAKVTGGMVLDDHPVIVRTGRTILNELSTTTITGGRISVNVYARPSRTVLSQVIDCRQIQHRPGACTLRRNYRYHDD